MITPHARVVIEGMTFIIPANSAGWFDAAEIKKALLPGPPEERGQCAYYEAPEIVSYPGAAGSLVFRRDSWEYEYEEWVPARYEQVNFENLKKFAELVFYGPSSPTGAVVTAHGFDPGSTGEPEGF